MNCSNCDKKSENYICKYCSKLPFGTRKRKTWILGAVPPYITPTKNSLAKIMNGIILFQGKITSSHSLGVHQGRWTVKPRYTSIEFAIELPVGTESMFEDETDLNLSEPKKIHLN